MATIENLSQELLMEVFSHYVQNDGHETFLKNIPRVCKHWNELSSDSSLWKDVRTRDWNFLLNVSRRGFLFYTQSLRCIWQGESYSDTNLSTVLKNIRDLKALELRGNTVGGNTLMVVAGHRPHLESLQLMFMNPIHTTSHEWNQFLNACGPTLKHLDLNLHCSPKARQHLVSRIAAKCPLLETFSFCFGHGVLLPIHKLGSGCPRLKELEFWGCRLITAGGDESLGFGFKDLKKFGAIKCDFGDLDIYSLLKESIDLEHLKLHRNINLVFCNVLKIPSDKIRILDIWLRDPRNNLKALEDAVFKWRRTLSALNLRYWECDVRHMLKNLLKDNTNPPLESLSISKNIDPHFLKEFVVNCRNLFYLKIKYEEFRGREKIKEALESLLKRA